MTNSLVGSIIVLMIILIIVVVLFALLDRLLKGSPKKTTEKSVAPKKTVTEKPVEEPAAKTLPEMKIYNSELADDLNAIIKNSNQSVPQRLQIENHIDKESNISKYLRSKNYRSFDFGTDDENAATDDEKQPLTFTREDYKRIMALSNIDDKKPL